VRAVFLLSLTNAVLGVMNPSNSFAEASRRAFVNLSLDLQRCGEDDDNFTEELEEFLKIMANNDVDEEDFYKHLEFEHEDEGCAVSTPARNYPTHATRVTFDDDDVELANYLTEVEFSDPRPRAYVAVAARVSFFLVIIGNLPPQEIIVGHLFVQNCS